MAASIRTDVQVMFFDTDCGGVVSNIAYLRFIEIGAHTPCGGARACAGGNGAKANVSRRGPH